MLNEGQKVHKENYSDHGTIRTSLPQFRGPAPRGCVYVEWDDTGYSCERAEDLYQVGTPTPLELLRRVAHEFRPSMDGEVLLSWAKDVQAAIFNHLAALEDQATWFSREH